MEMAYDELQLNAFHRTDYLFAAIVREIHNFRQMFSQHPLWMERCEEAIPKFVSAQEARQEGFGGSLYTEQEPPEEALGDERFPHTPGLKITPPDLQKIHFCAAFGVRPSDVQPAA